MALVGDYDASTFVDGSYATYPPLPAGVLLYQPAMWWRVSVAGTVQGQAVVVDDLLFATQGVGRTYGEGGYGDQIYGGLSDGGWTVEQVFFLRWDSTLAPPDLAPYPNAGCAFTRDDLPGGNWAPGWRVVVEAFYDDLIGSRTYGAGDYGDEVYGDEDAVARGPRWIDLTQPSFEIQTGDGNVDGAPRVPVAEVVVTLLDETGAWFDISEPATWHQPQPGTPLRVGFLDPTFAYHPVVTAEIERIEDVHERDDGGRVVSVRGFGRIMDLTVDVPNVQRPAEQASTRFAALAALAGWRWDVGAVVFPGDDAPLLADDAPRAITVRDEMDRTVQSAGWFLDTDRRGRMRVRRWPHEPTGTPIEVVDCRAPADTVELVSPQLVLANDMSQILNRVVTTNTESPTPGEVAVENTSSRSRFGRLGRAYGFPKTGLAWSSVAAATEWARRALNRFAFITRHVEILTADTLEDPGWLPALAALDTGQAVHVDRRALAPLDLDGVVVGWRHTIEPGRWQSTVFVSTTTSSF